MPNCSATSSTSSPSRLLPLHARALLWSPPWLPRPAVAGPRRSLLMHPRPLSRGRLRPTRPLGSAPKRVAEC
eukprot:4764041-Alexandrium_andersonii.AAC.1